MVKKYTAPVDAIVWRGKFPSQDEFRIETATEMYPGRLVKTGTTEDDIVVGDALSAPIGWLGYEQTAIPYMPATKDTIYAVNDRAIVGRGGGFGIRGKVSQGCVLNFGDKLANWTNGQLVGPVLPASGGVYLGIPFVKAATPADTGLDLPADMIVYGDPFVDVATHAEGSSIDVGTLASEAGGDADGFLDGVACTAATKVWPVTQGAAASAFTLGSNLRGATITSADSSAIVFTLPKGYVCDGVATSIAYTTSNHTVAGRFWLHLMAEGLQIVAKAQENVNAASAATTAFVQSLI